MPAVTANGIRIEVGRHGPESGVPLLLIRGLGSQLIHWPEEMIDAFVAAGHHVIVFDNRDSGLSESFEHHGRPDFSAPGGPDAPYSLDDMADDAAGVLDALGVRRAHVLGISMGGMILQCLALAHPDRVLSATIVMSSSGAPDLPGRDPEVEALLTAQPANPDDREQVIEQTLAADRVWGNPGFPFDEAARRALIGRAFDRRHSPGGVARQYAAARAAGQRHARLPEVRVPTLVIHGTADVLLPVEHGRDIAARIPGARLVEIGGMGHDLDGGVAPLVAAEALEHVRASGGQGPERPAPGRSTPSSDD